MSGVIEYARLKAYLKEQYGYSEGEAVRLLEALRGADAETRRAFWHFYSTGELPEERIHGVRLRDLMELRGMDEFAAFQAVAWLGREPLKARWRLMNPIYSRAPGDETLERIREVAREKRWDLGPSPLSPEDESDIPIERE